MDDAILQEWLFLAAMDLDSALLLKNARPQHREIICFHCQQSAEKHLKAFLFSLGQIPPKTHNLIELCLMCSEYDACFRELMPACEYLTPFGVVTRYPHELDIFDHTLTRALQYAEQVNNFSPIIELKNKTTIR